MRPVVEKKKLLHFLEALAGETREEASVFLTGGATALLYGWRQTTIDVDLKADPEPKGFFEALSKLKDHLQINLELASPPCQGGVSVRYSLCGTDRSTFTITTPMVRPWPNWNVLTHGI